MNALLRLYPASYRREFGDEIADAHREATDGASRTTRMREAADIAGHALRMRLGLGSAGRTGRLLAAVAPFAVIAVGVYTMFLTRLTFSALRTADRTGDIGSVVLTGAGGAAALVGVVLALTGRWASGTWTALAGLTASTALQILRPGLGLEFAMFFSGPALLTALVAGLCPPDLRPTLRPRLSKVGVVAALAGTAVLTMAPALWPLPYPLNTLPALLPTVAGLLLAGRQVFARLRTAPAVLLASLPFAAIGVIVGALDALLLPLLIAVPFAAVVGIRNRRRGPAASLM
ncbi:hypothetical protein OS965_12375 [Streptomyces sp. H27-G5]|uniref:hypothetical protein n=1 Tax=Streptomyces sp. H27-G5 TaxID=2996698 RepID=UPI00227039F2|nr:hypothetical protein [Streptomyces sp. H27-G5]MCY0918967.1 hypothetical protein [Streptomyces sp. H27-G5]